MKKKVRNGCLDLLIRPIDFTGPLGSFIIGHAAILGLYGRIIRNSGHPKSDLGYYSLLIAALLFASFVSMVLWGYSNKMLAPFFGDTSESRPSPRKRKITKMLGFGSLVFLFAFYLNSLRFNP